MTDSALKHVTADGVRVAYQEVGSGEPVVLIHGYPQSHEMWRHQIGELAKTHRVIAVDWFGWGGSERNPALPISYEDEVARMAKLFDALELPQANLAVHDYAGYIGVGFVLAHPARVSRFAILNSRAHETFPRSGFWATWLCSTCGRIAPGLLARIPLEKVHRLGLEPYEQASCFDQAQVDRYVGWMGESENRRWFARFFAGYSLRPRREQLAALAKLEIPTAVIWGDADPWCPSAIGDELARVIPGAVKTTIPHGLHFITEHKPVEVTEAIRALLARPAAKPEAKPIAPEASRVNERLPPRESENYRGAILAGWAWLVCAGLVFLGLVGLFTDDLGPIQTNQVHALALNLSVGLLGFAFARFALEHVFLLAGGIGMVALSLLGFNPSTQDWMFTTFNVDAESSWVELVSGVVSLVVWVAYRPRPAPATPDDHVSS